MGTNIGQMTIDKMGCSVLGADHVGIGVSNMAGMRSFWNAGLSCGR
jgi:hypothetical protein